MWVLVDSQAITHNAQSLHTLADLAAEHAAMLPVGSDARDESDANSGQHILADFV